MKRLWKEYPATVVFTSLCIFMILTSIILYFVLGATELGKVMLDYGTPGICVGMILFIFEMMFVKHGSDKDDKT